MGDGLAECIVLGRLYLGQTAKIGGCGRANCPGICRHLGLSCPTFFLSPRV